ncbi:MAG: UPF0175 family protein [Deltaproteobacteria bacterium]|nr:UPF0175 family protein [Deltaproteobacteria bacterium]
MPLQLEFSDEIQDALRIPPDEQEGRLRRELARLYEKGLLSLGKARQLAGMEKWNFLLLLAQEGISRQYDKKELVRDLSILNHLP